MILGCWNYYQIYLKEEESMSQESKICLELNVPDTGFKTRRYH